MKKSEIIQEVNEGMSMGTRAAVNKLLDVLIGEAHKANESNRGEELLVTQGRINGFRLVQMLLIREKK